MDTKPLNILCLDGGGVRALSSLLILRSLMQQLKLSSRSTEELRPCDVFDMICGTSTGGLIALMLGRLRMGVDEAIGFYLDFSRTVFQEKNSKSLWTLQRVAEFWSKSHREEKGGQDPAIYDSSKLEEWVKGLSAQKLEGDDQAPLKDPREGTAKCCRTFVVAATQVYADSPPKRFRTYSARGKPADTCTIWEAARATTAALPFFGPASFGVPRQTYIDGSFSGSNNPSRLAIDEAGDVFPSRKIGCFLSLGTGVPDIISAVGGPEKIAKACMKLIKNCEVVHDDVGKAFITKRVNALDESYFRFSVDRGLGKIELDEWNRDQELTAITDGYMRYYQEEEKAKRCVGALTARAREFAIAREDAVSLQ